MSHRKLGYKFENDWTTDEMTKVLDNITSITVVPVNTEIEADQVVLNFDNVMKLVNDARRIAVIDCDCRAKRKHCNAPLDVCIGLDTTADEVMSSKELAHLHPHEVNSDEASKILRRSNEAGLVHMAYLTKGKLKTETICSCCSCCCENLGAILRYGLAPHLLKGSAVTSTDESKCTGCGVCVDRCHFGARKVENDSMTFDKSRCYGCGLCVNTCPTGAITLHQTAV